MIPALGHSFADDACCGACGISWHEHQENPQPCKLIEWCPNGHQRPPAHGELARKRPAKWVCQPCVRSHGSAA